MSLKKVLRKRVIAPPKGIFAYQGAIPRKSVKNQVGN